MSKVVDFLQGKTLLITGSTGFLAKGLVEKILRVVPDVERIYLLIRSRGGENGGPVLTPTSRLEREILRSSVFGKLREIHGDSFETFARERLVAIDGDLTKDGLGLDPQELARLSSEVQIVINSAATVVFDEQIDEAINLNTLGPQRLLKVAKTFEKQPLFVHVSTAYVSGQQREPLKEKPLPTDRTLAQIMGRGLNKPFNPEMAVERMLGVCRDIERDSRKLFRMKRFQRKAARSRGGSQGGNGDIASAEKLRFKWLREQLVSYGMRCARQMGWHDSYTLTKALGEQLISLTKGDLPTVIIRPSIIESSLSEPEPGWLDGLKVADGIIAPFSKGRLPDFPGNPKTTIDLIPVDFVVNAILASIPQIAAQGGINFYHVSRGSKNPIRLRELVDLGHDYFKRFPMRGRKGEPIRTGRWTYPSPWLFRRWIFMRYQFPLSSLQWLLERFPTLPGAKRLKRRVTLLRTIYDRAIYYCSIYSTYTRFNFEFKTDNTTALFRSLSCEDQGMFGFDVKRINWPKYIQEVHIPGLKKHVLQTRSESIADNQAFQEGKIDNISGAIAGSAIDQRAVADNVPTRGG